MSNPTEPSDTGTPAPAGTSTSTRMVIRVPPTLRAALDAAVARRRASMPGQRVGRSDIVRELIHRHLVPAVR